MEQSIVLRIQEEIKNELSNEKVFEALATTVFKGLEKKQIYLAIQEGMIRDFSFKNFLLKDVYAIPYGGGYSLVTSIDFARKLGAKGGICGKDAPKFFMDGSKIVSCAVTVKKMVEGLVGDFTAEVYFDEYFKEGKNGKKSLWETKPRTMIAKVAEMHALRMACPDQLSKIYVEEEFEKEVPVKVADADAFTKAKKMIEASLPENLKTAKERLEMSTIFTVEEKAELNALINARLPKEEAEAVVEPIAEDEVSDLFNGK